MDTSSNQLTFKSGQKLKILFASSEVSPFSKSGGLGDVANSLPAALKRAGHDVRIITPLYRQCREKAEDLVRLPGFRKIRLGQDVKVMAIEQGQLPETEVPVYFVACDEFFDRPEMYREHGRDYKDNAARFIFFSRAVLEFLYMTDFQPDVIHVNDWQTGLVPVFQRTLYAHERWIEDCASVFTVHNMAYQGVFWHLDMPLTGLPWSCFTPEKLEYYGMINLMKGGLVWADALTTVSESYAKEIQTQEFGFGLDGVLRSRSEDLFGVLNGVDMNAWNPATDQYLPHTYSADNLEPKKLVKKELQKMLGLNETDGPLLGMVTRLCDQKGIDIIREAAGRMMAMGVQLVILGKGDPGIEDEMLLLASRFPGMMNVTLAFDEKLAHLIEAGSDIYLMPSRYEPCGLNQMYSMIYGTVPIVRETGGLADTVPDYSADPFNGRGFSYRDQNADVLLQAIGRAVDIYRNHPEDWKEIMRRAMKTDFSWDRSAALMEDIYRLAMEKRR